MKKPQSIEASLQTIADALASIANTLEAVINPDTNSIKLKLDHNFELTEDGHDIIRVKLSGGVDHREVMD